MIRIIFLRESFSEVNQMRMSRHYTMDVDVPELERELSRGGFGETGYDFCSVVGVEVIPGKADAGAYSGPDTGNIP